MGGRKMEGVIFTITAVALLGYVCYLHMEQQKHTPRRTRKQIEVERFYEAMGRLGFEEREIEVLLHDHKSLADLIEVNNKMMKVLNKRA